MAAPLLHITAKKQFEDFSLDISETLKLEGTTAIFGPSGSGKTTLLRLIAGFDAPDNGLIKLGDTVFYTDTQRINLPAHRRHIGFLFQNTSLFPHLTVKGNLDYADTRRSATNTSSYDKDDIIHEFDLLSLMDRRTGTLSGGEAQRVALARALLTRPHILLLDEPLSALDIARKADILPFLKTLPRRFGVPLLYVSHDLEEVSYLADKVILFDNGRVTAKGGAIKMLNTLQDSFSGQDSSSGLTAPTTFIEACVQTHNVTEGLTYVTWGTQTLCLPLNESLRKGTQLRLQLRARDVALAKSKPKGLSLRNILPARIVTLSQKTHDPFCDVVLSIDDQILTARLTRAAITDLALKPKQRVYALIKAVSFYNPLT